MRFLYETTLFDDWPPDEIEDYRELIEDEMEQKCWIVSSNLPPLKQIQDLIDNINPKVISFQIKMDHLTPWCEMVQANINELLNRIININKESGDIIERECN